MWLAAFVKIALAKIKKHDRLRPTLALVLGSGFNHLRHELEVAAEIPYAQLPGFPRTDVEGHEGKLCLGRLGGIHRKFRAGDFMMLTDHLNFIGENPLRGPSWPGLRRFVDLTDTYDAGLRRLLRRAARVSGVIVKCYGENR